MTDSVSACISYKLPMVTCDGVTPPSVMQITVILSRKREMKQEEQHVFIWSLLRVTVSGLRDGGDLGVMGGGLPFHVFACSSDEGNLALQPFV